jgi:hypothetical protein
MQDIGHANPAAREGLGEHRGVLSGVLDTTLAAFIIALGATANDMEGQTFFL